MYRTPKRKHYGTGTPHLGGPESTGNGAMWVRQSQPLINLIRGGSASKAEEHSKVFTKALLHSTKNRCRFRKG